MIWRRDRKPDPDVEQARERLEEAQRDLQSAKDDNGKVNRLAWQMHEIRQANRFAAMMKRALRGTE